MFPGFGQQIVRFHEGKLFIFQFNRFSDNLARVSSGILSLPFRALDAVFLEIPSASAIS